MLESTDVVELKTNNLPPAVNGQPDAHTIERIRYEFRT